VAFLLLALERADAASDRPRAWGSIVAAGGFAALAIAVKGTTAFFVVLVPVLLVMRAGGPGMLGAAVASGLAFVPAAAWYWHAHAHLGVDGASFGVWGGEAGKWGSVRIWLDVGTWRSILGTLVVHAATPLGFAAAVLGASRMRREPELRPFVLAGAAAVVSALVVAQGFRIHNYYQLAWLPFVSVLAGAGAWAVIQRVGDRAGAVERALVLALAIALGGWSILAGRGFVQKSLEIDPRMGATAPIVAAFVPPEAGIIVVDRHPQSLLYAMDRRGFHRTGTTMREVLQLQFLGAEFIYVSASASAQWMGLVAHLVDTEVALARGYDWWLFALRDRGPVGALPAVDSSDDDPAAPAD
jgi:hypothetical protein